MNRSISSNRAGEILRRITEGQSIESISTVLDIPVDDISSLLGRIKQGLLPKQSRRKSPAHKLTAEDRGKGGKASQLSRQLQRDQLFDRTCRLVNTKNRSIDLAVVAYSLLSGSPKEFRVTIPDEGTGLIFLKALKVMGVEDGAIHFHWRQTPNSSQDETIIRSKWGQLGSFIEFSNRESIKSLSLRVSSFSVNDTAGKLKISSRGLAQAFLKVGNEVLNAAAK